MDRIDRELMRACIQVARSARRNGNHPFGALLVDSTGRILLEAENTVTVSRDCTAHAELNLVREASAQYESDFMPGCTIYCSTEPCPMCAGAIYWSAIGRVVYGLGSLGLYGITAKDTVEALPIPCREIFGRGRRAIEVVGPLLEEEARLVHEGFWEGAS